MLNICQFKEESDINCLQDFVQIQQELSSDLCALKLACSLSEREEKPLLKKI